MAAVGAGVLGVEVKVAVRVLLDDCHRVHHLVPATIHQQAVDTARWVTVQMICVEETVRYIATDQAT
jgi:hypothetical protein